MRVQITKNFYLDEFSCKDLSDIPVNVFKNILRLAEEMQKIRDYFQRSITVNSGYRSPDYNKSIGGAKQSQHLLGTAADIVVKGFSADEVANAIEGLNRIGAIKIGGLSRYDNFTHVDTREKDARWDNRTK